MPFAEVKRRVLAKTWRKSPDLRGAGFTMAQNRLIYGMLTYAHSQVGRLAPR